MLSSTVCVDEAARPIEALMGGLVEHEKPAADQKVLQGISARPRWAQNDEQRDRAKRVDECTAEQDAETLRGQAHKPEHHAPEHERKKTHHCGTIAFAHSPHAAAFLPHRITKPPHSTGAQAPMTRRQPARGGGYGDGCRLYSEGQQGVARWKGRLAHGRKGRKRDFTPAQLGYFAQFAQPVRSRIVPAYYSIFKQITRSLPWLPR